MPSALQRELQQTKPFGSLREEAALSLWRTASGIRDEIEALLHEHGLSSALYNVLRILRGAGPAGLGRNDIRDRLVARMPDVTRLLDRLEAMGLARRERSSGDRRIVSTTITDAGGELLARIDAPLAALHEHQLRHLSDAQLRILLDLLALARTGDASAADHSPTS